LVAVYKTIHRGQIDIFSVDLLAFVGLGVACGTFVAVYIKIVLYF